MVGVKKGLCLLVPVVSMIVLALAPPAPVGAQQAAADYKPGGTYAVYFATTRLNEGSVAAPRYGGSRHLDNGSGSLEYGVAKLVRPAVFSLANSSSWEDYKTKMVQNDQRWGSAPVSKIESLSAPDFYRQVAAWRGPICVFTHGYDQDFDDSLRDLAVLTDEWQRRRGGNGILPIVFTWPSAGKAAAYQVDAANANWSTRSFITFIDSLAKAKQPSSSLDVVAHSLGNLLITDYATRRAGSAVANTPVFRNLIMADPDVDFQTSEQNKGDCERLVSGSVQVLVSDRDGPLITSQILHGQPRLGRPIDPPGASSRLADAVSKGFWKALAVSAAEVLVTDSFNNPPEVANWLAANPALDQDYGPKTRFIDVSEIVAGDFGHRMAFSVIAGLLNDAGDMAPLTLTVVHKRPDKLTLSQSGGTPRVLYRFYKVDSQRFKQK